MADSPAVAAPAASAVPATPNALLATLGEVEKTFLSQFKAFFLSTKVWAWLIANFGGVAIIFVSTKLKLDPQMLTSIITVVAAQFGISTTALIAAKGYVDAHTAGATLSAQANVIAAHLVASGATNKSDASTP